MKFSSEFSAVVSILPCLQTFVTGSVVDSSARSRQWSNLYERTEVKLNIPQLRKKSLERRVASDPFIHTPALMAAIDRGEKMFETSFAVDDVRDFNLLENDIVHKMSFKDISKMKDFSINSTHNLFQAPAYHSLDVPTHVQHIRDVLADGVVHCDVSGRDVKVGDFIVGSSNGDWHSHPVTSSWAKHAQNDVGLMVIRKVVALEPFIDEQSSSDAAKNSPLGTECFKVSTENIHTIELFESFHTESVSHVPFFYSKLPEDFNGKNSSSSSPRGATQHAPKGKKKQGLRTMGDIPGDTVDAPAVACAKGNWPDDDQYYEVFHSGGDDDFSLVSGWTEGCVQINAAFPCCSAFTWNYDPTTDSAVGALDLDQDGITGLSCPSCYAYSGAFILAVVDFYSAGEYMAFEAKLDGAIGFNVQVSLDDPTVSGASTITLLDADPSAVYSIPLGYGLALSTSFGGLQAVISGSGSATGTAGFGMGASAEAFFGVGYSYLSTGSGWTNPTDFSYSINPPYFTSSWSSAGVSVSVELIGTQMFTLQYEWLDVDFIGAQFSLALSGSAELQYDSAGVDSSSTSTDAAVGPSLEVSATVNGAASPDSIPLFSPGDVVQLTVKYSGFNPLEHTKLFFSVHRESTDPSPSGVSILQGSFTVSESGSGVLAFNWTVPWDTRFMQPQSQSFAAFPPTTAAMPAAIEDGQLLLSKISVRASNRITKRFFTTQSFVFDADNTKDFLVTYPSNGVELVADEAVVISWVKEGLTIFERTVLGASGIGEPKLAEWVNVQLMMEVIDAASGAVVLVESFNLNEQPMPNSGSASLRFPSSDALRDQLPEGYDAAEVTRRFFVMVKSSKWRDLQGWSSGYFTLTGTETPVSSVSGTEPASRTTTTAAGNDISSDLGGAVYQKSSEIYQKPWKLATLNHRLTVPHAAGTAFATAVDAANRNTVQVVEQQQQQQLRSTQKDSERRLQTCTTSITLSSNIDAVLTDVIVCEIPFSVGAGSTFSLLSGYEVCVSSDDFAHITPPPPASPSSSSSNTGGMGPMSVGAVVGIALGGVSFIAAVLVVLWYLYPTCHAKSSNSAADGAAVGKITDSSAVWPMFFSSSASPSRSEGLNSTVDRGTTSTTDYSAREAISAGTTTTAARSAAAAAAAAVTRSASRITTAEEAVVEGSFSSSECMNPMQVRQEVEQ